MCGKLDLMTADFSDDALLLIAHGSTVNAQSSELTRRLTRRLDSRKLFAEVACAFKLEEPYISDTLKELSSKRVFAAPITISEGQFTEEIIPFHLGLCTKGQCDCPVGECNYPSQAMVNGKEIVYCRPIGTHKSMTDVLLGRAKEIVQRYPFPKPPKPEEICLIIAGHGTKRNLNSRKAIEAQVQAIKELNEYAGVQPSMGRAGLPTTSTSRRASRSGSRRSSRVAMRCRAATIQRRRCRAVGLGASTRQAEPPTT